MDDASCVAEDVRINEMQKVANGPRPRNDAPSAAIALAVGDSATVVTAKTDAAAEAPCVVDDPEFGEFELPMTHTVWWTITGTGGPTTVDTAGSDFDTVLGVYLPDGDVLEPIACVDDVIDPDTGEFSLAAAVTIDTVAGQTYYVQSGSLGNSPTGTLVISVE